MPKYGDIKQLKPSTYVADLREDIQAYLRHIHHRGATIGKTVVWVRYGHRPSIGRGYPRPVAIGPTRESVLEPPPVEEKRRAKSAAERIVMEED